MLMLKVFLISLGLIAIAFAALGIRILIKKKGQFPHTHIGGNKEMIKRGIYCAQTYDKIERKKVDKERRLKALSKLTPDPNFLAPQK
jgi:hypothetical protein